MHLVQNPIISLHLHRLVTDIVTTNNCNLLPPKNTGASIKSIQVHLVLSTNGRSQMPLMSLAPQAVLHIGFENNNLRLQWRLTWLVNDLKNTQNHLNWVEACYGGGTPTKGGHQLQFVSAATELEAYFVDISFPVW